ncbi:hypothetical protein [Pedococcus soli]
MSDVVRWLANDLSQRPDCHVSRVAPDEVTGRLPTGAGPAEFIFETFSEDAASIRLFLMAEPSGSPQNLVSFHQDLEDFRSNLFDRRIDVIAGEMWLGKDLLLPRDPLLAQRMVGQAIADLASELPELSFQLLRLADAHHLHARD